jgi:hypothetical protein
MAEKKTPTTNLEKNVVTKITVRAVGLDPKQLEEIALSQKGRTPVLRVAGIVEKHETKTSHLGEFERFSGKFVAVNLTTGAQYRAKGMILPEVGAMVLCTMMENVEGPAEFGLDITVEKIKNDGPGYKYKYGATSLIASDQTDVLDDILAKAGGLPALPAPE